MYRVFAVLLLGAALFAQTKVDLARQTGNVDFTGLVTKPFQSGASLPGTCTVNQMFWLTTATAGQNLYGCTATNTWTLEGGTGGAPGGAANSIQTNVSGTLAGNAGDTLDTSGNESIRGTITTDNANPSDPGTWSPSLATVSNLSTTCSGRCPFSTGSVREISDGTSTSDCTVGGGSSKALCKYNGSTWEAVTGTGGGLTPTGFYLVSGGTSYCGLTFQACVPASGLTILNTAGSSTINSTGGTQVLQIKALAGDNLVLAGGSIAGGNTSLTVAILVTMWPTQVNPRIGACFRESAAGKMSCFEVAGNNGAGPILAIVRAWTNQTTAGAAHTGANPNIPLSYPFWIKLSCSVAGCATGNTTFQISADGTNFNQGFTQPVGTDFTTAPNQWGVFGSTSDAANDMFVDILSYKVQ